MYATNSAGQSGMSSSGDEPLSAASRDPKDDVEYWITDTCEVPVDEQGGAMADRNVVTSGPGVRLRSVGRMPI
jgi:hypothetical protein